METQKNKSKLVTILHGIASRYHDSRAYDYRALTVLWGRDSTNMGISEETAREYEQKANRCSELADYHWKLARKYEGDKQ